MKKELLIATAVLVACVLCTTSFARDRVVRLSRGVGHGGSDIVVGRSGNVLASGCITKVKDMHRVESVCDCDCAPSYELNGRCVRGPKGVALECLTEGWSRKHGKRVTAHFANGHHIHVHDDGLIDHDD